MIATTKTTPHQHPAPVVADPRRSYDRGIWVGGIAGDTLGGDHASTEVAVDLATIRTEEIHRELDRRQRALDALVAKRAKLIAELADLDAQIRELQGEDRPVQRAETRHRPATLALPRLKNSLSLPDAIALEAEVGEVVTPAESAKRVLTSGYQSNAVRFETVVASAMSKHDGFRRVGRGRYERVG